MHCGGRSAPASISWGQSAAELCDVIRQTDQADLANEWQRAGGTEGNTLPAEDWKKRGVVSNARKQQVNKKEDT